ncbi:MAG: hypothetical protein HQL45_03720 [Alphaproteobacteria bacterium]|nr:hypothetical protein [Alphaproteobacteria bacterium]
MVDFDESSKDYRDQVRNTIQHWFTPVILKMQGKFCWQIMIDGGALEECVVMTHRSLKSLQNVPAPNQFKKAGHYAYWIRKLKPLQVITETKLREILIKAGKVKEIELTGMSSCKPRPGDRYVNEIFAFCVGAGIIKAYPLGGKVVRIKENMFNDLIVTCRYETYSPSSLSLLFEALTV